MNDPIQEPQRGSHVLRNVEQYSLGLEERRRTVRRPRSIAAGEVSGR